MPSTGVDVDLDLDPIVDLDGDVNVDSLVDLDVDPYGHRPVVHTHALRAQLSPREVDTLAMLSFQRLDVYQRSIEFLSHVLEVIAELPKGHADIADQLRRAAQSQPLNIAEGAGRRARLDIAKHYTIARGSAMECAAILDVMRIQQTIKPERYERGIELLTGVIAMLTKMI